MALLEVEPINGLKVHLSELLIAFSQLDVLDLEIFNIVGKNFVTVSDFGSVQMIVINLFLQAFC